MRDPERRIDPPEYEVAYCPECGAENPRYIVEDCNHILGCETCLTIKKEGIIQ